MTHSNPAPAPQAGIKLLEDIIKRVHSQHGVLAGTKFYQQQQIANVNQQSLIDPMLAIRPQERRSSNAGGASAGSGGTTLAWAPPKGAGLARFEYQSNRWDANKPRAKRASNPGREELDGIPAEPTSAPQALDERQTSHNRIAMANKDFKEFGAPSAEARRKGVKPLSQSVGGLSDAFNKMSMLQNAANGNLATSNATVDKSDRAALLKTASTAQKKAVAPGVAEYRYDRDLTLAADMEGVRTYPATAAAAPMAATDAVAQNGPTGTIALEKGGLFRNVHEYAKSSGAEQVYGDEGVANTQPQALQGMPSASVSKSLRTGSESQILSQTRGLSLSSGAPLASNLKGTNAELIAMLPPNVISGIPLVRLGISVREAAKALARLGPAEKQEIDGWTVLVVNKPQSTDAAIQLYVKHGMVEAMRVFDGSLIAPDFGVNLGDELPAVKKRFGEPAFMLTEPGGSSAGQNYVYPISQVGLQLARTHAGSAPHVVSLLIFNIK